jgi:hypothetical protein
MLKCTVKFCGGCNPRYDRGAAFAAMRDALADLCVFSSAQEGERYDVLLIIRGCTGCPYLYESLDAKHRFVLVQPEDAEAIVQSIRRIGM